MWQLWQRSSNRSLDVWFRSSGREPHWFCENLHLDFSTGAELVTTGRRCVTAVMKNWTGGDGGASVSVFIYWKQIKTAAAVATEAFGLTAFLFICFLIFKTMTQGKTEQVRWSHTNFAFTHKTEIKKWKHLFPLCERDFLYWPSHHSSLFSSSFLSSDQSERSFTTPDPIVPGHDE